MELEQAESQNGAKQVVVLRVSDGRYVWRKPLNMVMFIQRQKKQGDTVSFLLDEYNTESFATIEAAKMETRRWGGPK